MITEYKPFDFANKNQIQMTKIENKFAKKQHYAITASR